MSKATATDPLVGRTLSHYQVAARVGTGGMGVVYRATDSILRRDVALKVIREDHARDPEARARFLRECRAAAGLAHPNIAAVYDAGETGDGLLYFVTEWVEGETLHARLARGRLETARALDLGTQLAQALAAAHAGGVVHRDIKPSNLMISPDGRLKVLDFGLARLATTEPVGAGAGESTVRQPLTQARMVVGTPAYMSPEQAAGLPLDERTDVFSAGAVIFEMISGRSAFGASTPEETLRRVLSAEPEPLEKLDPAVPPDLTRALRRALEKDRTRRLASARELAEALAAVGSAPGTGVARPEAGAAGARRRRLRWALALALVGFCVGGIVWHLGRPRVAFARRDTLLVADVDNRTDDPVFDIALKSAIETDLQQSRYANVFEQGRVRETLGLMRRERGTRLSEDVGRDICRYAGLKALLLPRILKAGDVYDLYVLLVDPGTGRTVDRVRVTVRGREAVLLKAVDQVTRRTRALLGEPLASIRETDIPVAQATTSSWEALRDLTLAQRHWSNGRFGDAGAMFQRALDEDPHFMAARGSLGLLLIQFLGEPERGKRLLREALAESDSVSRREQLMVRALYKQFVEADAEGALKDYKLITESYPDLWAPYNNSGMILRSLGRVEDAIAAYEKAARAARQSLIPLSNLYWTHLTFQRDPAAAESVARRMVALDTLSTNAVVCLGWSFVPRHRFADAEREFRRALRLEPDHALALSNLAHVLLASGRTAEAVPLYRRIAKRATPEGGEFGAANVQLALALRAAGAAGEADRLLEEAERRAAREVATSSADPATRLDLAQIPAARGRAAAAEVMLRGALRSGQGGPSLLFQASEVYALLGRPEKAVGFLRRALDGGYWDRYTALIGPQFASLRTDPAFRAIYPERPD